MANNINMMRFKWMYCDAGKGEQRLQVGDTVTMLVPEEYGGKAAQITIKVSDNNVFDAYFAGVDVYQTIANWNRQALAARPDFLVREGLVREESKKEIRQTEWFKYYSDLSLSPEEVTYKMTSVWRVIGSGRMITVRDFLDPEWLSWKYRHIGIVLDNEDGLPFPPKFARNPDSIYENCPRSLKDPDAWC